MDVSVLVNLANAAASLEAAQEAMSAGCPFWSAISAVKLKVQSLIEDEACGDADYTEES